MAPTVLVFSLAGAIATLYAIDRSRCEPWAARGALYRSPRVLRRMSLGYTGLLADIYWTRAVQYFGEQHLKARAISVCWRRCSRSRLNSIRRCLPPYQFGANFLAPKPPNGAGLPGGALRC